MNIYTFDSEEEMVKLASIRMLLNKIQTVSNPKTTYYEFYLLVSPCI